MIAIKLKKSIRSIFIGLTVMTAFPVMAASDNSTPGNGDAILTTEVEDPFRKRMPSKMCLYLTYTYGRISITSDFYDGEFALSLEKYETGVTYEISSIHVGESVTFDLEYGEYQVTAVAHDGIVLAGFMQVY